eukprot:Gregarina_sp_Poly_1__6849@NODE_370_length_9151_cov_14_789080_g275_i1_p7_GENE_NODE_370_length_9151_cov_14_789080_g275_i1NODE_370_length_9151_cov_14_789080_g275_i1_p7_ORF_typecomplete_len120_score11_78_NODE_370_length_9151_cov_14_789080_g275_i1335694
MKAWSRTSSLISGKSGFLNAVGPLSDYKLASLKSRILFSSSHISIIRILGKFILLPCGSSHSHRGTFSIHGIWYSLSRFIFKFPEDLTIELRQCFSLQKIVGVINKSLFVGDTGLLKKY